MQLLSTHISRDQVYVNDYAILKRYRDDYYLLSISYLYRRPGFEAANRSSSKPHEQPSSGAAGHKGKTPQLNICPEAVAGKQGESERGNIGAATRSDPSCSRPKPQSTGENMNKPPIQVDSKAVAETRIEGGSDDEEQAYTKHRCSLSRTSAKIFELAMCNDWEYLVTLTFDGKLHDRRNLKDLSKRLGDWLDYINGIQRLIYLLIPEQHKDGSWHMHGLIAGIPSDHLGEIAEAGDLSVDSKLLSAESKITYNWEKYAAAFGRAVVEPIEDIERVSNYLRKDVSKEKLGVGIEKNMRSFYRSKGLKKAVRVAEGPLVKPLEKPFYQHAFGEVKVFRNPEDAAQFFIDEKSK